MDFDYLGAEEIKPAKPSLTRALLAVAAGLVGSRLVPRHPVLAFLGASALASNAHAVATGEKPWQVAVRRMGCHLVATAGSLALPKHPAIGYVAAAIAGDLVLDGKGGGVLEEWMHGKQKIEVSEKTPIDAEIVETNSKALVKK